jgi:uncharacterized protein (TIGR03000 family)
MTRRLVPLAIGPALAAALLTGPAPAARAQYISGGGPIYVRPTRPGPTGPSLFIGAYAPSFYDGGVFGAYNSFNGAGLVPYYNGPTVSVPAYTPPPRVNYTPYGVIYNPPPPPPGAAQGPAVVGRVPDTSRSAAAETPPPTPESARFTVKLPADAKLWVDQFQSQQTGPVRTYHTPAILQPSKTYEYTFRAQWPQDGQTVTRDKTVRFTAGSDQTVDFAQESPR